jgi:hypothetical protein
MKNKSSGRENNRNMCIILFFGRGTGIVASSNRLLDTRQHGAFASFAPAFDGKRKNAKE